MLLFNYIDKLFQILAGVQVHLFSKDYSTTKNLPHALGTAHSTERHNTNEQMHYLLSLFSKNMFNNTKRNTFTNKKVGKGN